MASPHPSTAPVVPLEVDRISEDRITIVESDPDLSDHDGLDEPVSREVFPYVTIKLTWLDHLRGLLCFGSTHQVKVALEQASHTEVSHPFLNVEDIVDEKCSGRPGRRFIALDTSNIRSVKGNDQRSRPVPKQARCMLDTGNLTGTGNAVSQSFVEEVLGFSRADYAGNEEGRRLTTASGRYIVTIGTTSLTWYARDRKRLFRGMRFLVSADEMCGIVIGMH